MSLAARAVLRSTPTAAAAAAAAAAATALVLRSVHSASSARPIVQWATPDGVHADQLDVVRTDYRLHYKTPPPLPVLIGHKLTAMEEGSLIFKNVSFSLPAGGAMLVQGANGAGKTSLLDMIVGDLPPVAGRLIWDSVLCDSGGLQLKRWEAERFCWFEDPGLPQITPNITVQQQIELFSINSNTHYSATHVLKLMRLWELRDLMTNILSTGQRKRLALSRLALVARPVWLLDEPTLGLDTQSIALLEAMIRDHRQRGGMLIIASHADIALENAVSLRM